MNDETTNKAIELTDDELDNITGGRAVIIMSNYVQILTQTKWCISCDARNISASEFLDSTLYNRKCDKYSGPHTAARYCYELCSHCRDIPGTFTGSDADVIKTLKGMGYGGYSFIPYVAQ